MRRLLKWFWLFNKRLYKKASFVMILALILLSVFMFGLAAKQESGILSIVLVRTDKQDNISRQVVSDLIKDPSMILFTEAEDTETAIKMIETGKVDSAWIFEEDLDSKITKFARTKSDSYYMVRVVEREQNVLTRLVREKLTAKLYHYAAKAYFLTYTRDNLPALENLSDKQLNDYFDNVIIDGDLFVYGSADATFEDTKIQNDYLTTPLRGLLSVVVVLCGMAAVLYYIRDERKKTFACVPFSKRIYVTLGCVFIAALNVCAVMLLSLYATGMATVLWRELICGLLFAVCIAAFCSLIYRVFPSLRLFSALIPVLIIIMIGVCPVFFNLREVRMLSFLFPPTYYINAVYSNTYLLYMIAYTVICLVITLVIDYIIKRKKA